MSNFRWPAVLGHRAPAGVLVLFLIFSFVSCFGADIQATITFTSPKVPANEGYATDGTNHYLMSFNSIAILDSNWKWNQFNDRALAGFPLAVNHIGDGAYFDGKLYAPVEHWHSCDTVSNQTIAVYNMKAKDLPLIRKKGVSANGQEVASIAIAPSKNELYTASYCDSSKLMVYNLKTLTLKRTIPLSRNIKKIQGISWNSSRQQFAMTSDNPPSKVGFVYLISPDGKVTGPIYTTPALGEMEGVDYTQGTIRYLIDNHVYYLTLEPPK